MQLSEQIVAYEAGDKPEGPLSGLKRLRASIISREVIPLLPQAGAELVGDRPTKRRPKQQRALQAKEKEKALQEMEKEKEKESDKALQEKEKEKSEARELASRTPRKRKRTKTPVQMVAVKCRRSTLLEASRYIEGAEVAAKEEKDGRDDRECDDDEMTELDREEWEAGAVQPPTELVDGTGGGIALAATSEASGHAPVVTPAGQGAAVSADATEGLAIVAAPSEVVDASCMPPRAALAGGLAKDSSGPSFAATGFELSTRQLRIVATLGAEHATDCSARITHLLADTFRRTTKMMSAICVGANIVTPDYLQACRSAGRLVDCGPFALRDRVCEAAFARKRGIVGGYSLSAAVERARQRGPLLQGISVYCFPSVAEKFELPKLVEAAGGTWLARFPAERADEGSVLLLAERTVSGGLEEKRRKTHCVYDVELLREAACTQVIRKTAYRLR